MNTLVQHTIGQLKEIQDGALWIGSTYSNKLDIINNETAFMRPHKNLHSVAEIISHLTLWRTETILKITSGTGSKTDDCEENWLDNITLQKKGWFAIKEAYDRTLTQLMNLLQDKNDTFLEKQYYDTDFKGYYPYRFVLNGMIHHDLYHLGQIGLIIKFLKGNNT